jgi:hypothetical protein
MAGIFYNGKCYLKLYNNNELKNISLEDDIYFTLRDIFLNIADINYCMEANSFNGKLTNNIRYEERNKDFKYENLTNNMDYMVRLAKWLDFIDKSDFEFEIGNEEDLDDYIEFNIWWEQFCKLKNKISDKLHSLKNNKQNIHSIYAIQI